MRLARYALAIVSVGIAVALTRAWPELVAPMRLFFFWCAVLVSAVVGGMGPAVLAIVLSLFGASFAIFDPVGGFAIDEPLDFLRLTLFGLFAGAISAAVGMRRRAQQQAVALGAQLAQSESRYRTLVEATPVQQAVWQATAEGKIEWSDAWLAITGQTREEVERGGGMSVVHSEDAARTYQRWQEALAKTTYYEDEIRVRVAGGRYRWFALKAVPVRGDDQTVREWVGIIVDIHDRKQHEGEALFINRASELLASSLDYEQTLRNLARLAVPALGDWCAIDIARAGAPYERLVVEHSDPTRVQLGFDLDRKFRPAEEIDPVAEVIRTGETRLVENITDDLLVALTVSPEHLAIARGLGLRSWIIAPMTARGRILGVITVVHGESERHHNEEDVPLVEELARRAGTAVDNARLFQEAETANRIKDEFLATLSHELRTPLTAISGWAKMLQLGMTDGETTRTAVDTIVRSAQVQGELIDDLLDLSRVVAGKLHLDMGTVDLVGIVQQLLDSARPAASAREIALWFAGPPEAVLIRGDQRRVRQIIWNLISNAIKFTSHGGSVTIALEARDGVAHLQVRDTGKGISADFLPYVWERFRQADSSTSREYGGLGLGLSVVRHLVELHGGTVAAFSEGEGKGSTFTVELPLARLESGANVVRRSTHGDQLLAGRQILVVDDDPDARTVLAAMLRLFGGEVVTADSVEAAISEVKTRTFDAIVSDIAMPGEDGYSLARRVRATLAIPMIAVSAIGSGVEDREQALRAGFAEFLRKPVDPRQLAVTVARVAG
ncbi:MAG TPA: ATP-binding protein [Thermoanaerobaculia bacterium]